MRISLDEFRSIVHENSRRLSRTRHGIGDVSAGRGKILSVVDEERLAARAEANEDAACLLVWKFAAEGTTTNPSILLNEVTTIARAVNAGIVPEGKLFREWIPPEGERCPVEAISSQLWQLVETVAAEVKGGSEDAVATAALVEWALNGGELHPFYDGCGRISRLWSSRLLLTHGLSVPLWEGRNEYFDRGGAGKLIFTEYMRSRIAAGLEWLAKPERAR